MCVQKVDAFSIRFYAATSFEISYANRVGVKTNYFLNLNDLDEWKHKIVFKRHAKLVETSFLHSSTLLAASASLSIAYSQCPS